MAQSLDDLMSKYPLPDAKASSSSADDLMKKYPLPQETHSLGEKAQAALEGYGNAASAGLLPILQAGAQSTGLMYPDPNAKLNEELRAKGVKIDEPAYGDFKTELGQNIARNEMQAKEMPTSYYGGQLVGAGQALVGSGAIAAKAIPAAVKVAADKAAEMGPKGLIKAGLGYLVAKHFLGHGGE